MMLYANNIGPITFDMTELWIGHHQFVMQEDTEIMKKRVELLITLQ
jgi:hypothetical protein